MIVSGSCLYLPIQGPNRAVAQDVLAYALLAKQLPLLLVLPSLGLPRRPAELALYARMVGWLLCSVFADMFVVFLL